MLNVVCGIIRKNNGTVLVGCRPMGKHLEGKWEFPGGKIEDGESAETALHREIAEELGCEVSIVCRLPDFCHSYKGGICLKMIPFVCELKNDTDKPTALQHTELKWIELKEINQVELAEADVQVIANFLQWKSKSDFEIQSE